MKASIVAFSLLGALVSGLAVPEAVPRQAQTYRPSLAVNVKEESPDSAFGQAETGKVSRTNGEKDVQTLLSFPLPALPGKTCALVFSDPAGLSGTPRMKIYDVDRTVTEADTFQERPQNSKYRCTMAVKPAGQGAATVDDGNLCTFKCPESATVLGFGTEPADDNVEITWDIATAGLSIQAS